MKYLPVIEEFEDTLFNLALQKTVQEFTANFRRQATPERASSGYTGICMVPTSRLELAIPRAVVTKSFRPAQDKIYQEKTAAKYP